MAAWADKLPDHQLGEDIMRNLSFHQAVATSRLYEKTTDLFGVYSPVTRQVRDLLFWTPRSLQFCQFPAVRTDVDLMSPLEVAFRALRQMHGGDMSTTYRRVDITAVADRRLANPAADEHLEAIVSTQTEEQRHLLAAHDPEKPVFIDGPHMCYYNHKQVQYYLMRSDPDANYVTAKAAEKEPAKVNPAVVTVTDKDWWAKFYGKNYDTDERLAGGDRIYEGENFLPEVDEITGSDVSEAYPLALIPYEEDKESEFDKYVKPVDEGHVFAIAASDHTSVESLRSWVNDLRFTNPAINQLNVMFRPNEENFLLEAPREDPNDEDEFF